MTGSGLRVSLLPGLITIMVLILMSNGCSSNRHYDPDKPHHTQDGFKTTILLNHRMAWTY